MEKCPRCSGPVRVEPARLSCLLCGWDTYRPAGPAARRAQAALDRSLRSRSAESQAQSAAAWGPALEHERRLGRRGAGTPAPWGGPSGIGGVR
jgi:hypothetical protein